MISYSIEIYSLELNIKVELKGWKYIQINEYFANIIPVRSIETHDLKIDYTMESIDRLSIQRDYLPELTGYEFEIVVILRLGPKNHGQHIISMKNFASKFLSI